MKTDPLAPLLKGLRGNKRKMVRAMLENQKTFCDELSRMSPEDRLQALIRTFSAPTHPIGGQR